MSTITFDHAVIYNGVLYPANTPITEDKPKTEKKPTKKGGAKDNDKITD